MVPLFAKVHSIGSCLDLHRPLQCVSSTVFAISIVPPFAIAGEARSFDVKTQLIAIARPIGPRWLGRDDAGGDERSCALEYARAAIGTQQFGPALCS